MKPLMKDLQSSTAGYECSPVYNPDGSVGGYELSFMAIGCLGGSGGSDNPDPQRAVRRQTTARLEPPRTTGSSNNP